MGVARGFAGRAALSLAQQTSLSLLGTLAATALIAGLKAEWPLRHALPFVAQTGAVPPALTSGGKFASRVDDWGDAAPSVVLTLLPPILPLFTAPVVPALAIEPAAGTQAIGTAASLVPSKPPLHTGPGRHRAPGAAPLPPRRDTEVAMRSEPAPKDPNLADHEDPSLWTRSRLAYSHLAAWTGLMADHLLP